MVSSFNPSPIVPQGQLTPLKSGANSVPWSSAFKGVLERAIPTPRNLTQELNSSSPWMRSLDVSMSDKYFSVRLGGDTPVRGSSALFGGSVPQVVLQSPGGDVVMRTAAPSINASPLVFSPPRQRMRYN